VSRIDKIDGRSSTQHDAANGKVNLCIRLRTSTKC